MNYPTSDSEVSSMARPPEAAGSAPMKRVMRPGQRPLVFSGSELAMAMSYVPDMPYWYELNIYRTTDQQFVLCVKQFFQSEVEQDKSQAWQFDSLVGLFDALEEYDAASDIRLPSPGDGKMSAAELASLAYDLQAKVISQRAHFASLVGELFAEIEAAGQMAA